jgi:hypothetical protein
MKRSLFMGAAAAAGATAIGQPFRAGSEELTRRVRVEANVDASAWRESRVCESAVVWLDSETSIYYYKGDRWYGRTERGAYACEKEAIKAGNRASPNGQ